MAVKVITISLPKKLAEEVREYSHKSGRKFSGLVAIALEKFIEQESKKGVSIE